MLRQIFRDLCRWRLKNKVRELAETEKNLGTAVGERLKYLEWEKKARTHHHEQQLGVLISASRGIVCHITVNRREDTIFEEDEPFRWRTVQN